MNREDIKISRIVQQVTSKQNGQYYSIIWIKNRVRMLVIDNEPYDDIANAMFFLNPKFQWKIIKDDDANLEGYVFYVSDKILNEPALSKLQINDVRLLNSN